VVVTVAAPSPVVSVPRGFLLAGTHSGVGKTSLSLGLMGAYRARGHAVAPFKVGPDYIDPTYHSSVCGRPSRNLDTWLMSEDEAVGVFRRTMAALPGVALSPSGAAAPSARAAAALPLGIVEGVMGLFDGLTGSDDRCSSARVAKLLGLPVILVVDCSSMARSVAAVVHGFRTFDPELEVAGVVLNKVAGANHEIILREALGTSIPIVGVVPRRPDLHLTSRHLGLIPTVENEAIREILARIVEHVADHVDMDLLLQLARPLSEVSSAAVAVATPSTGAGSAGSPPSPKTPKRRVAVARDEAFSFYYQDNLDVLEEEGAEVVLFSPVAGDGLPACDALYLGGGYPEVYAERLAENRGLREELGRAVAEGMPLYAECGGYLYLGQEIEEGGKAHAMAGLLPTRASMSGKRLRLGYIEAEATPLHPLRGQSFRGHLFHYSITAGSAAPAYRVSRRGETLDDGWAGGQVVASYVHLHFRGSRAVARWLARGTISETEGGPDHVT
jgi:cobyrinic acid a,c-diamide synthase